MQEAVTQEGCVFCDIVGGKGTRKIYEVIFLSVYSDLWALAVLSLPTSRAEASTHAPGRHSGGLP